MKEAEVDENDENNEADAEDEPKGVKSPQKSKKKRKLKKSKGFIGTSYPFIYDTYRISMTSLLLHTFKPASYFCVELAFT